MNNYNLKDELEMATYLIAIYYFLEKKAITCKSGDILAIIILFVIIKILKYKQNYKKKYRLNQTIFSY